MSRRMRDESLLAPSTNGRSYSRRSLILCFDGTGNKFQGNSGDSNSMNQSFLTGISGNLCATVIKIFSLLDHQDSMQYAYYQPGIGTYVEDSALTKSSHIARLMSWYKKAKDQAVGTSFDTHIQDAYNFLMQHYGVDDDLYFFGFSRGAYTARFLAQMLDAVGLLSSGNEEMFRFAWKAFSQWQTRQDKTEEQRRKKKENFEFMRAFRETFSRPVRRVRFMGLFDTVNSVPRFETAWMRRSKFPYSAKSSTRVVRHAVAIDERRAKFRQNLISQQHPGPSAHPHFDQIQQLIQDEEEQLHQVSERIHHHHKRPEPKKKKEAPPAPAGHALKRQATEGGRFKPRRGGLSLSVPGANFNDAVSSRRTSINSAELAAAPRNTVTDDDDDESAPQDIQEIWFPGCHADIGGGWPLEPGEDMSLSHAPLIWMIREARVAGCPFDEEKLKDAGYILNDASLGDDAVPALTNPTFSFSGPSPPALEVEGDPIPPDQKIEAALLTTDPAAHKKPELPHSNETRDLQRRPGTATTAETKEALDAEARLFNERLSAAWTKGHAHDALCFSQGTPFGGVVSWRIMENMPFLRMDLQPDGTWAPIRWPLPHGEVRDIPNEAWIHHSAIRRMEFDSKYRPGNLIVGGGGRGMRYAPKEFGMGEWTVTREDGAGVGGVVVRANKPGEKPKNGLDKRLVEKNANNGDLGQNGVSKEVQ